MPTDVWFYQDACREVGPVSATNLLLLAREGEITPDTLVRKGADGKWVAAKTVKGLHEAVAEPPPPPRRPEQAAQTEGPTLGDRVSAVLARRAQAERVVEPPELTLPSPAPRAKSTRRLWVGAGAMTLFLLAGGVVYLAHESRARTERAEADRRLLLDQLAAERKARAEHQHQQKVQYEETLAKERAKQQEEAERQHTAKDEELRRRAEAERRLTKLEKNLEKDRQERAEDMRRQRAEAAKEKQRRADVTATRRALLDEKDEVEPQLEAVEQKVAAITATIITLEVQKKAILAQSARAEIDSIGLGGGPAQEQRMYGLAGWRMALRTQTLQRAFAITLQMENLRNNLPYLTGERLRLERRLNDIKAALRSLDE